MVTHGGKNVAGSLEIYQDGKKVAESPITDGKYILANPPKGSYKVAIKPQGVSGIQVGTGGPAPGMTMSSMPGMEKRETVSPPAKYGDPNSSGLTLDVQGGKETKDFPLD
jgi:hypothetical protein